MLAPTNFTLFSFFFQFLQICRQLIDVGIGEGIGFGKGGYKAAGAAAEQAVPHAFALGGQILVPRQSDSFLRQAAARHADGAGVKFQFSVTVVDIEYIFLYTRPLGKQIRTLSCKAPDAGIIAF